MADDQLPEDIRKAIEDKTRQITENLARRHTADIEHLSLIEQVYVLSERISENAKQVAAYGIIGVPDEVASLKWASRYLSDAQWAIAEKLAEPEDNE